MQDIYNRSELLLGTQVMERMAQVRVLLVGVGGVGSWCAESLIRTGIKHLTIIDMDSVAVSNINRQLMATTRTIGQPKVEVLRERLQEIAPEAEITAIADIYTDERREEYHLEQYDVIIDCIDSLRHKIDLLAAATQTPHARVYSSMGAALKLDPTRIAVAEFWKVKGCPLGAAMRSSMRKNHIRLGRKVQCVYSEERLQNRCTEAAVDTDPRIQKAQTNGSLAHITGIYGFTLAGLVISDIYHEK